MLTLENIVQKTS